MTNLQRRLRKLEGRFITDSSGLIPQSPEWIEYWMREIAKLNTPEDPGGKYIPFEAARWHLQNCPDCP